MGGDIWLKSTPGKGSTFLFSASFPRGSAPNRPSFNLAGSALPARMPILVAGENSQYRKILQKTINGWGFPCKEAGSSQKVIDELKWARGEDTPFSLIILEQRIGPMGLAEQMREIRKQSGYEKTPVVYLHNTVTATPCKWCEELHISFCLPKPPGQQELQEVMESALQGKKCQTCNLLRPATSPPDTSVSLPPMQLLLVEDNNANRELARLVLENGGHQVIEATNGLEALEHLCQHKFDAMLLDIQMPVLDGLAATQVIRQCEQNKNVTIEINQELLRRLTKNISGDHLPIVAMTAHAMAGDQEMCLSAGMDYYITKPFLPEDVYSVLKKIFTGPTLAPDTLPTASSTTAPKPVAAATKKTPKSVACPKAVKKHLTSVCHIPSEKVDTLLNAFRLTLAEYIAEAEVALTAGDAPGLRLAAHSLKGGLLNMGLNEWADIAYKLELDAKEGKLVPEHHAMLLDEVDKGISPLFCDI